MIITLPNTTKVVRQPEVSVNINVLTLLSINDNPINKLVSAHTKEIGTIVLWSGEDYDKIGQWTDNDVKERLLSLYSS
jgi:hypothetical protein